jgi:DNA mismatch repair protein MutS
VQASTDKFQLSIFDAHTETFENIRSILDAIDINQLTPLDALQKLQEIKNKIK